MTVAACVLLAAAMFSQSAAPSRGTSDAVPARPVANTFAAFSDESLWKAIVATGRVAVVGLKNPGEARGIWQRHVLLSPGQWRRAREAVLAPPGITLVSADAHLPLLTVRVADLSALHRLRQLPDVDYLEPLSVAPRAQSDSGCLDSSSGGGGGSMLPYPGSYSVPTSYNPTGTQTQPLPLYDPKPPAGTRGNMIPWNFWYHNIPQAWDVASGAGITVGVVDTGVYPNQSLLQPSGFNGGASSGRTVVNLNTPETPNPWDQCGHGTRVAGTIAAPRTGLSNIVGVAWNANLVTVRTMDHVVIDPLSHDAVSVQEGIELAYEHGARIINLSVGWLTQYWAITDEINYHLNDTLFVAAAGTKVCQVAGVPLPAPNIGVIYPAATPGVLAVTAVNADGTLRNDACWGPEVSLGVVVGQGVVGGHVPATGQNPGDIIEFGATSDAAAVTSGIAALIWSRFPTSTPDQVKQRLLLTAKRYSSAADCPISNPWYPLPINSPCYWGNGSPDAYAAVTAAIISVPNVIDLPATNAVSTIRSAGLMPIPVGFVDTNCENIGYVINQSPRAGTPIATGSPVTITVGVKPPNPCP